VIRSTLPHPDGDLLRLVTQPDHAHLAAEALALFRLPELVGSPRRDALLRAVRLHDNGWRELDAAPPVDAVTGLPFDFIELPASLRLQVWERGTSRYVGSDPYAALLATEHALALHAGRAAEEGWRELLARLEERRAELLATCALSVEELAGDYRWLDLADALSLAVCAGWTRRTERRGFAFGPGSPPAGGPARVASAGKGAGPPLLVQLPLAPFPLAGATTLALPIRLLPGRRYEGDAELGAALAAAPWRKLAVRLVPG
jgi:hypothetical protein